MINFNLKFKMKVGITMTISDMFKIKKFKVEILHLSEKLKNTIEKNTELLKELETIKFKNAEIQRENQTYKTGMLNNDNDIARLRDEIISFHEEMTTIIKGNKSQKEELEIIKFRNAEIQFENQKYEIKILDNDDNIARLKDEISSCHEELTTIIAGNKEQKEELVIIQSQNAEIHNENQTYKTKMLDNNNNITKLRNEIISSHEEMTNIIISKEKLKDELEIIRSQNVKIQYEIQTYKTKMLDNDINIAKLRDEIVRSHEEIAITNGNNANLIIELERLLPENKGLELENQKYKLLFTDDHNNAINIKEHLIILQDKKNDLDNVILNEKNQINDLENEIKNLKNEVVVLDDEILYQSFCLYTPLYDLTSSKEYKYQLDEVRMLQKQMLKNETAATCHTNWTVDGNIAKGKKMTSSNIKQILRSFNNECENVIDRVKFNNIDSMKNRITKAFESLNSLNETNSIVIQNEFLELKFQELSLAYEYQLEKQNEKDELRMLREQQREEVKLLKEIEDKRREIEKEQQHYINALSRLDDQISFEKSEERLQYLLNKKNDIQNNLVDLDLALKEIDYREANQRAGYVYIISNIGAFGKNVYKIGMTRRLDPQDRVDELGNASVPFKFDIHAMIFSDNAPKLENSLHKAFDHKKINTINNRKEFFNVTLEEIEEVVKDNHDRTVDFINIPPAQQYRETLKKKENGSAWENKTIDATIR